MPKRAALFAALLCVPAIVSAVTISIDDFESGSLSAWQSGSHGQIVADPLRAGNHVLNFTAHGDGGDIWTANTYAATGSDWWLSFDYLGRPDGPGPRNFTDSGGFIGWDNDQNNAGVERWLAGTQPTGLPLGSLVLTDDVQWHHYVIHLVRGVNLIDGPVYFKAEDWLFSDAAVGNAFFDNIVITDVNPQGVPVPEPGTLLLLATGFGLIVTRRVRR